MGSLALLRNCYRSHSHQFQKINVPLRLCMQRTCATASQYGSSLTFLSPNERTTNTLAAYLARGADVTDCVCLYGDVGAGKSVFSRAFIRAYTDDPDLPVPSPTYLLQNTYDNVKGEIVHHFDLYRLAGPSELGRLELDDALSSGICLFEWAERLGNCTPSSHLAVHMHLLTEDSRDRISGEQGMREKIERTSSSAENAGEEDCEEEEGDYVDRRWRRIVVVPHGDLWAVRLEKLAQQAWDRSDLGLILLAQNDQTGLK